jgi:hypothetical protein
MGLFIGCDLSTHCSGFAIFDESKKLIKYGQIKPKTTLSTLEKIIYTASEFYLLFQELIKKNEISKCIIEDIYLSGFRGKNNVRGFASLGRVSGAVMMAICFATGKQPDEIIELRMANVARPLVGVSGSAPKAAVQIWALQKFFKKNTTKYEAVIEELKERKSQGLISKDVFKKRLEELSKKITEDTGIGEDCADAILLGFCGLNKT